MAAFKRISGFLSGISGGGGGGGSSLHHQKPGLLLNQLVFSRGIVSKLFVGGLSFYTTENALAEAFAQFGQVVEAKVVMDRVSDRSKGFGFVTFASEEEANRALNEMNGKMLNGRVVFVDTAKARGRFGESLPIARGPPEPPRNDFDSA